MGRAGHRQIGQYAGLERFFLKHEGENPTGSFKDRGMTSRRHDGHMLGARAVACASTGNTSASLASYAAQTGMHGIVFLPAGNVAGGKLAQTLAYGATTVQIEGDFDDAMRLVERCAMNWVFTCSTRLIRSASRVKKVSVSRYCSNSTGRHLIGSSCQRVTWAIPPLSVKPSGRPISSA